MSLDAMTWAWEQQLVPTDKFVLLAIADLADEDGTYSLGLHRIAKKCRLNARRVRRLVDKMVDLGLIRIEEQYRPDGSKDSNLYFLSVNGATTP